MWESKPDVAIYKQIFEGRIKPVRGHESSISTKVAEVIDQALSRDPEARYQDAGAMLEALKVAL